MLRINLTTKLFAGFVLLLALFAAVVGVNYRLAEMVLRNSQAVEASQATSAESIKLLRNIIDMETGFRGYLLVGREQFLVPYHSSERELLERFSRLHQRLPADTPQRAHLDSAQHVFRQWLGFTQLIISEKRDARLRDPRQQGLQGLEHAPLAEGLAGKLVMDAIRFHMGRVEAIEEQTRQAQRNRLATSIVDVQRLTLLISLLGLGLGLAWALYLVRLLGRRLREMLGLARRIASGDYEAKLPETSHDELNELSTALNTMARTIGQNIRQLESRNRELDQFAYVVSHDLKAPLRGIESASRWIEEDLGREHLPAHIQEFLQLMRQRVRRMENLITGILALARVGRVAQANEPVFVRQLVREIADNLALPTGMQLELPFFLPTLVTNRTQLEQVFSNLISNAVKYHHHPGTGTIRIGCEPDPQDERFFRFAVQDDGPGIAPEYHEKIFVIFQTLVERDTVESTGVGLAIVKKIVERQGGRIWVESAEGQGATFYFTWPKQPAEADAAPTTPPPAAAARQPAALAAST